MRLLEYEAKSLLSSTGLPIPRARIIKDLSILPKELLPAVVKSQVPVGGRGKLGGILFALSPQEYADSASRLFKLPIKGHVPKRLLVEEKIGIAREFYLSLVINQTLGEVHVLAHTSGGIEVEANARGFATFKISEQNIPAAQLAKFYGMNERREELKQLLSKLHKCFVGNDATLIEINPLVLTSSGELVCADAKIELDDAAAFRHNWQFEAQPAETSFVTINLNGNVATVANGAGLAMATVDAVFDKGLVPANFLDIGGGATTESVVKAFRRIMEYANIDAVIINIFAGITKCDEVAKAIIEAKSHITELPPLYIRLAGTNFDIAADLLRDKNIPLHGSLEACLSAAAQEIDSHA